MKQPRVVLKFGSSVLSEYSRLPAIVHEIYRHYRQCHLHHPPTRRANPLRLPRRARAPTPLDDTIPLAGGSGPMRSPRTPASRS